MAIVRLFKNFKIQLNAVYRKLTVIVLHNKLKSKRIKKYFHANINQKGGLAVFLSDK